MATLTDDLFALDYVNRYTRDLPADPQAMNLTRPVFEAAFSKVQPTPVSAPELLAHSPEMLEVLGLAPEVVEDPAFVEAMAGNRVGGGMEPFAMVYGGHQFGHWAGQLGDGRAIALGEVRTPRQEHWTLQLKGAGPTPYSRTADGRAVLRSSVREFLCSEAMAHLGVPTTRALTLVSTGDAVPRDMFYDGNQQDEPGAVVCRVARTFIRFGHFQLPASRGDHELLRQLVSHTIRTLDGDLFGADALDGELIAANEAGREAIVRWYERVARRTAHLMVEWGRVGFVHGVMNTDNMSVLGETIDYGPYGWLEGYDPDWTPNTTDAQGRRYAFGQQSRIGMWNVAQLGNALVPLVEDPAPLQAVVEEYGERYASAWRRMMAAKLGLEEREGDLELVQDLLRVLSTTETDFTIFFRRLGEWDLADVDAGLAVVGPAFYAPDEVTGEVESGFRDWLARYAERARSEAVDAAARRRRMHAVNPKYVLRNYLAQEAIDLAAAGDPSRITELLDLLRRPYDEQPERERYFQRRPEWARHKAGCSMLSCSS